jgi:hypothetical protein
MLQVERDVRRRGGIMSWTNITRHIAAVVLAGAIPVALTTAFAESAGWSDRLGLGLFLMTISVWVITTVHCHRMEKPHRQALRNG